jgi:hypothetical protein
MTPVRTEFRRLQAKSAIAVRRASLIYYVSVSRSQKRHSRDLMILASPRIGTSAMPHHPINPIKGSASVA